VARILWSGIAPYHKTGYGVQCALFAPRLAALGHQVVIHRMGAGVEDDRRHPDYTAEWEGVPIIGGGLGDFGLPPPLEVRAAFGGELPDLVLVLKDAWVLNPRQYARYNTAVWCNIDCDPMGVPDRQFFEASGARPIAVSRFGKSVMRGAGLKPLFVPHGVNLAYWTPGDQGEARELLGLPQDVFIAGINAANLGKVPRKAFYEQLAAFEQYRRRFERRALLLMHTQPDNPEGVDLRRLAEFVGLGVGLDGGVIFGAHMNMREAQMRTWYRAIDVLLNATYGEGFGVPIVEALACGRPVIATRCTAMTEKLELGGAGWLVDGQPFWNEAHGATWCVPKIGQITAKLAQAYARRGQAAAAVMPRQAAEPYDADTIASSWWPQALEALC
jgi:glycosyltransferase involved in cell wall biosynthesis